LAPCSARQGPLSTFYPTLLEAFQRKRKLFIFPPARRTPRLSSILIVAATALQIAARSMAEQRGILYVNARGRS